MELFGLGSFLRFLDNLDSVPFWIANLEVARSLAILLDCSDRDSTSGKHFLHFSDALRE
jgi:hypothetical protein